MPEDQGQNTLTWVKDATELAKHQGELGESLPFIQYSVDNPPPEFNGKKFWSLNDTSSDRSLGENPLSPRYIYYKIASTGEGWCYKAYDFKVQRWLNLKVKRKNLEFYAISTTEQEGSIQSLVDSPHIPELYNIVKGKLAGEDDERSAIAMQWIDGGSVWDLLRERIKTGIGLSPQEVIQYCQEMGEALSACHKADVLHRDFKPSNNMRDKNGKFYLIDFGYAVKCNKQNHMYDDKRTDGIVIGANSGFTAPELAAHDDTVKYTSLSDIFAFGVSTYEVMTGYNPFANETFANGEIRSIDYWKGSEQYEADMRILTVNPHQIQANRHLVAQLGLSVCEKLDNVFTKVLAKNPQQRYQTVDEFVRDFTQALSLCTNLTQKLTYLPPSE